MKNRAVSLNDENRPLIVGTQTDDLSYKLDVFFPNVGFLKATYYPGAYCDDPVLGSFRTNRLSLDRINVNEKRQGEGIGTVLTKYAIAAGKSMGATSAYCYVASPQTTRILKKIVGLENIALFDEITKKRLEMTAKEAIAEKAAGYYLLADISKIDTSGLNVSSF